MCPVALSESDGLIQKVPRDLQGLAAILRLVGNVVRCSQCVHAVCIECQGLLFVNGSKLNVI
jgi:hypothetical protein